MRKKVSLCDLLDHHNSLNNQWKFEDKTKEERRADWKDRMEMYYPDLEPCPFCGGHPEFTPHRITRSYFGRTSSVIECFNCELAFKAKYESDECIEAWNKSNLQDRK